ncbi:MAG: VanZ family protein [Acidobacteria bacterium]|nr:VanZ family protein [Acidobacteriota bacterium]
MYPKGIVNKLSRTQRGLLWAAWLAGVLVVIVLSLLPNNSAPIRLLEHASDKVLHFGGYLVLGLIPVLIAKKRSAAVAAVASVIVLGLALEFGQLFVPGRNFDVRDYLADDLGVFCGVVAGGCLLRRALS